MAAYKTLSRSLLAVWLLATLARSEEPFSTIRIAIHPYATGRLSDLPQVPASPLGLDPAAGAGASSNQRAKSPLPARRRRLTPRPFSDDGAIALPVAIAEGGAVEAAAAAASPPLSVSFEALDDDGTVIPPDTNGAVGPDEVMTALNSQIRVQDRAGKIVSTVNQSEFWGGVAAFDPRAIYDAEASRWILTAAGPGLSPNSLFLAISQTSAPNLGWDRFRIPIQHSDLVEIDYPHTGLNRKWIVVHGDVFSKSNNTWAGSQVYIFDRAKLYASQADSATVISRNDLDAAVAPVVTLDPALDTMYLLSATIGAFQGTGILQLYTIDGPVGFETLTIGNPVFVPLTWDESASGNDDFLPQQRTSTRLDAGDDRMATPVFRDGSLWAAHTIFLPPGGHPTRCSIQWYQLSPAGAILQRGLIDDPTGAKFYAYPSIAVNKNHDVLLGYSRCSASEYPSAFYSFHGGADPAGELRGEVLLRAGVAPYDVGTPNRWGDFSTTVVDPKNDSDFWTLQEISAVTAPNGDGLWDTWWGMVSPAPTSPAFERGDANSDGKTDLSDAITLLNALFLGTTPPACVKSADMNDDGSLDVSDAIVLINHLFLGGIPLPAPSSACGQDPTDDGLGCDSFPPCGG